MLAPNLPLAALSTEKVHVSQQPRKLFSSDKSGAQAYPLVLRRRFLTSGVGGEQAREHSDQESPNLSSHSLADRDMHART